MRFLFGILVFLAAVVYGKQHKPSEEHYQFLFTKFVEQHKKHYEHGEFFHRYNIFKTNMDKIMNHNNANHTYTLAMNEFGDLSFAEFKSKYMGYKNIQAPFITSKNTEKLDSNINAATSLDWRSTNNPKKVVAVTAVKNQQQCGSCWAFSSTGSMEGTWAIAGHPLVSLSEQQLVDCSSNYGNQGCNGGLMAQAFEYVIANGGICSEAAYPYQAADGTCQTTCTPVAKISSYTNLPQNQESTLIPAIQNGPISIAIEADTDVFQFYSGGVFSDPSCGTNLDHGVLIVGYGTDSGKDYWIVKNSWGASWGENGYIRLIRNQNMCGLAMMPVQPKA